MVEKCLKETENTESPIKSVAIPALGTGYNKYPADTAARSIFDAVMDYRQHNMNTTLEEIKIVVYPESETEVQEVYSIILSRI